VAAGQDVGSQGAVDDLVVGMGQPDVPRLVEQRISQRRRWVRMAREE
jgi:hypothetical protein